MRSPSKSATKRIRDVEAELNLPPGFRFHPTDEELIVHYLGRKSESTSKIIADIDLYKHEPWELPEMALFGTKEWYFFTSRERKYRNGSRPNRVTQNGYWKATGADKPIKSKSDLNVTFGIKKGLVFYAGKGNKGIKTNWIIHEYRLNSIPSELDDQVLCRLYNKKNNPNEMIILHENNVHPLSPLHELQKENSYSNNSDDLTSFEYSHDKFCGNVEDDDIMFLGDSPLECLTKLKGTSDEINTGQTESLMQKEDYANDWLDSWSLEDLHHYLEAIPPNNLDIYEMPMIYN